MKAPQDDSYSNDNGWTKLYGMRTSDAPERRVLQKCSLSYSHTNFAAIRTPSPIKVPI